VFNMRPNDRMRLRGSPRDQLRSCACRLTHGAQQAVTMRVYKCNPRCYNAVSSECSCQCNGLNHGVGEAQARENFRSMGLIWKIPAVRKVSVRRRRVRKVPPEQASLFASIDDTVLQAADFNAHSR
jgi:hypothetical protein